ncbi:MAG: dgt [Bacteroidetes bacterium]|nr:dgt [Bacteroidota bacterium]
MNYDDRWSVLLTDKRFRTLGQRNPLDKRNPFEDDYSRLISSPPIRRLQDKTQVFPLEKSDFIRTRLTHSLEVSFIAKSIGKSVEEALIEKKILNPELRGYMSSLLFTAGLVHDLGNPPFGHFGETAIQDFFKAHFKDETIREKFSPQEIADFENFDGNVQAFRILRKLHFLKDENSYNLTYPTLSAIIKYPRSSISGNKKDKRTHINEKKSGYFITEQEDYNKIDTFLNLNGNRHPVTYLLEAADDIAYSAADIEDGVKLGILNFDKIKEVFETHLDKKNAIYAQLLKELEDTHQELKNTGLGRLDITIQRFRITTQSLMIIAVVDEFLKNYEDFMNESYNEEILDRFEHKSVREAYKGLMKIVLDDKKIIQTELAGYKVLTGLLEEYIPACSMSDFSLSGKNTKARRLYYTISSTYRFIYETYSASSNVNPLYCKYQLVTDILSGMTDHYALNLYQNIKGISL